MPHRHYVPKSDPPSLADRLLAHTYVAVLGAMSILLGTWVTVGALTGVMVFRALEDAPPVVRIVAGVPLIVGGLISVYSVVKYSDRTKRLKDMEIERYGATILSCAWFAYAVAIALGGLDRIPPGSLISLAISVSFGLGAISLFFSERRIVQRVHRDRTRKGA